MHKEKDMRRLSLSSAGRVLFMRRLALYLKAGIPLIESIELMGIQGNSSESLLCSTLVAELVRGTLLPEALSRFPQVFRPIDRSIIAAGYASGSLVESLGYVAHDAARHQERRRALRAALAYPVVILLGTICTSGLLLGYAFPKIVPLFDGLHATLPRSTRTLLWITREVPRHSVSLAIALMSIAALIAFARRSPLISTHFGSALLKAPYVGAMMRSYYLALAFGLLARLTSSGIRLDQAIAFTAGSMVCKPIADGFLVVEAGVMRGMACSALMRSLPSIFPTVAVQLVEAGERSGTLSQAMQGLADIYDQEFSDSMATLGKMLEPVLMLVMGAVVGFIAMSIIAPMYALTQNLHG